MPSPGHRDLPSPLILALTSEPRLSPHGEGKVVRLGYVIKFLFDSDRTRFQFLSGKFKEPDFNLYDIDF